MRLTLAAHLFLAAGLAVAQPAPPPPPPSTDDDPTDEHQPVAG